HFIIKPPAPLALAAKKVVDHALHDLTMAPAPSTDRVFELGRPLRPPVFVANWSGRCKQLAPGAERGSYRRAQLPGEGSDGLFHVDFSAIDFPGCKQLRKLLENVLTNHCAKTPSICPAYDDKPHH